MDLQGPRPKALIFLLLGPLNVKTPSDIGIAAIHHDKDNMITRPSYLYDVEPHDAGKDHLTETAPWLHVYSTH